MNDLYDALLYRPITDLMEQRFSRILPSDSAGLAVQMLAEDPDHVVIVTDGGSKLSGIITVSDQAKLGIDFKSNTAKDLATSDRKQLVGVRSKAKLGQLLRLMDGENKLHRPVANVPVVDDNDRVIGLVNRDRLNQKLKLLTEGVRAGG